MVIVALLPCYVQVHAGFVAGFLAGFIVEHLEIPRHSHLAMAMEHFLHAIVTTVEFQDSFLFILWPH